jgi:hypothetical protein
MTELTERARKLASGVEVMGLPNYPDCSLRDCADTLRMLCDENDQLRAALANLIEPYNKGVWPDGHISDYDAARALLVRDRTAHDVG